MRWICGGRAICAVCADALTSVCGGGGANGALEVEVVTTGRTIRASRKVQSEIRLRLCFCKRHEFQKLARKF